MKTKLRIEAYKKKEKFRVTQNRMILEILEKMDHNFFSFFSFWKATNIFFFFLGFCGCNPLKTLRRQHSSSRVPRGLTACCTSSVQSCHLRKWCNNLVRVFSFSLLILLGDEQKLGMGVWLEFILHHFISPYHALC